MAAQSQVYAVPPFAPDPANILCGLATASGNTIITIPAGRVWQGTVVISANVLVGINAAAVSASARISTAGAGVTPAAGDYIRLDIGAPITAVSALTGTSASGFISGVMLVAAPSGNSATLVLNTTNTTTQSASAVGVLL